MTADLSCQHCRTPHLILGDTPEKRHRAVAEWEGCCPQPLPVDEWRGPNLAAFAVILAYTAIIFGALVVACWMGVAQ